MCERLRVLPLTIYSSVGLSKSVCERYLLKLQIAVNECSPGTAEDAGVLAF